MKVLMVHDSSAPVGGAETYLRNLTALLESHGHEVYQFLLMEPPVARVARVVAFAVEARGPWAYWRRHNWFYPRLYRALRSHLKTVAPGVVHLHGNRRYPGTVLSACRGYPVVQTVHDAGPVCPSAWLVFPDTLAICPGGPSLKCVRHGCIPRNTYLFDYLFSPKRQWFERRYVTTFIAPSRWLKARLERHGYQNVVHLPHFAFPTTTRPPSNPARQVVLYVGSLTRHKGVSVLLHAFRQVVAVLPGAALWMVGSGPEEPTLRNLAAALSLQRMEFLGHQPPAAFPKLYQQATCVAIPSVWMENAPLVCYEAMACGTPVVASSSGGIPELITSGENGWLVERGNVGALAAAIVELLRDGRLQARMGEAARSRYLGHFTPQQHLAQLVPVYEQARRVRLPAAECSPR